MLQVFDPFIVEFVQPRPKQPRSFLQCRESLLPLLLPVLWELPLRVLQVVHQLRHQEAGLRGLPKELGCAEQKQALEVRDNARWRLAQVSRVCTQRAF